jgi:hypothetical protein
MGCHHGYGYEHGCWGPPWADLAEGPGYGAGYALGGFGPGYGRGYGYRRGAGFGGVRGPLSREAAAAQLEAYLAGLRDEVRALEADLDELRGASSGGTSPQV